MSTYNLIKKLYKEIDQVNVLIDTRIKKGLSYKTLSRRHKILVDELRSLQPQPVTSILPVFPRGLMNRLAQYVSVFLM